MIVNVAVEGPSDAGAARRVVETAGHTLAGEPRVARGKSKLDPKIAKYNQASRFTPWIVFRDSDSLCPVELRARLEAALGERHPRFILRIAHSMTESWLLADLEGFAEFFSVSPARVPAEPDDLVNAKVRLLQLCGGSRSRAVRRDLVAADGGPGPLYVSQLVEFAKVWDVDAASERSPSLRRAVARISSLS